MLSITSLYPRGRHYKSRMIFKKIAFMIMVAALTGCSTTIYLARHAEQQTGAGDMMRNDPPLTQAGRLRAKALADSLTGNRLSAVFSTPYKRTLQTAEPTAIIMARPVITYSADNGDKLVDSLSHQKNRSFLVVGHSNTVPAMLRHIGLNPNMQNIDDNDYDNFFVVRIHWGLRKKITLSQ